MADYVSYRRIVFISSKQSLTIIKGLTSNFVILLISVFCCSASGAGQGSIDNRIEQAMVSVEPNRVFYYATQSGDRNIQLHFIVLLTLARPVSGSELLALQSGASPGPAWQIQKNISLTCSTLHCKMQHAV